MNNTESIEIINRFYKAIDMLVANKTIRGVKTFTDLYNINRRNFVQVSKTPQSDMFQMSWITHLINDFGISSQWIMTGNGEMFTKDKFTKEG